MATVYYTEFSTPLGMLTIESHGRALTRLRLPEEKWKPDPRDERVLEPGRFDNAVAQLNEYFAGDRRTFDLPLAPQGTPFQLKVWKLLREIPWGQTITYASLARQAGNPRACRAVGAANGRNPLPIILPCHRVIGADGRLTGYGGGLAAKQLLLELEGAVTRPGDLQALAGNRSG